MSEPVKAAFVFLSPTADYRKHIIVCDTGAVHLTVVGVKNYSEAKDLAKKLVSEGISAIELCGGFGHRGTALVSEALQGKIPVGVVRFDIHPALDNKSGDHTFS